MGNMKDNAIDILNNRIQCTRCSIKHLGKASILMKEMKLGYPVHVWLCLANMSEAEDEIIDIQPEEAKAIREERMKIEASLNLADLESVYVPEFDRLMMRVAEGGLLPEVTV
jgi:hypothetical protein